MARSTMVSLSRTTEATFADRTSTFSSASERRAHGHSFERATVRVLTSLCIPWATRWPRTADGSSGDTSGFLQQRSGCAFGCLPVADEKENAENQVDHRSADEGERGTVQDVKHEDWQSEREFLQSSHRHHRSITRWVSRDDEKQDVPYDDGANEAVVVLRMRHRRRELTAGPRLQKVLRRDDEQTVDARDEKDVSAEFHSGLPLCSDG